jgi:S1-C subfamily serine protease
MWDDGAVSEEPDTTPQPAENEPERPDLALVLVRACVLALWSDGSMAAVERDALAQVIASVGGSKREQDRLRQLALQDLNQHAVLAEVERLAPDDRLHLFDRCIHMLTIDRRLGRGERDFLASLRTRCGVGYWAYQQQLWRITPLWKKSLAAVAATALVAVIATVALQRAPGPADETGQAEQQPARALPEEASVHPDLALPAPPSELVRLDPEALYETVRRSVVTVYVRLDERRMGNGSGAVIGLDSGLQHYFVVTNRHVVVHEVPADKSLTYEIEFENGARFDGVLDFYSRRHDLALLAVMGKPMWAEPVAMRRRHDLTVGEPVYAVGSPIGLRHTFTSGVISALRPDAIQTDATVHSGSSGGPLFDSYGLLCGVITASHESKDFSFALYSDSVLQTLVERYRASAAATPGD